jgi:hypothetical protein
VAPDGRLWLKQRDGTVRTVEPNETYGRTAGLRSILDGVDVAINHVSIQDTERRLPELAGASMPSLSATMFERIVQRSAELHTPGLVSDVNRADGALSVTYHGPPATYEQLKGFADALIRVLAPNLPVIKVFDESGEMIQRFRPPPKRAPVGRNDPCPCGSGKKYKRCHGG